MQKSMSHTAVSSIIKIKSIILKYVKHHPLSHCIYFKTLLGGGRFPLLPCIVLCFQIFWLKREGGTLNTMIFFQIMDKKFFRCSGGYPRHIGLRSQISKFSLEKKTQEGTTINIQGSLGSNLMKVNIAKPPTSFSPLDLVQKLFATEV